MRFLRTRRSCDALIARIAANYDVQVPDPVANDQVRNIVAGSSEAARRAGNKHASVALRITAPSVTPYVIASVGVTPYSMFVSR